MAIIDFSFKNFPSLGLVDFTSTWQNISLEQLSFGEQQTITTFLAGAEIPKEQVSGKILLAKTSGGLLEQVYGGAIFANEERSGLMFRLADNYYPVTIDNGLRLGKLDGSIVFSDRTITVTENDKEYELIPAKCEFIDLDNPEDEYHIRCSLDASTNPTPSLIKAAIRRGDSAAIARFFKVPKSGGGGDTLKMQDLGEGRFPIKSWKEIETRYGLSVIINLEDGRSVWGRNPVSDTLLFTRIPQGAKLELLINNITALPNNRFKIACGVRYVQPIQATQIPDEDLTF